ncbi:MAG: hypothetical protein WAN65_20860 [Candidatus Sulfotelmatobacter sp.]
MKSMNKLSMIALAVVLCFAPFAFGQATAHSAVAGVSSGLVGHNIFDRAVPGILTFAFDRDHGRGGNGGNNGCSQGGNGWDDKDKRNNGGGNCQSVPEGGSNLMYLFLASLACFGVLLVQSLRKVAAPDQHVETTQTKQN